MTDPIGSIARQIAGLAGDIARLAKTVPSYQRGVVANVSPPTVIMDRDVTATPRPVADVLVPGLAVGQRVEVRVIGSRRVITSIHPADNGAYVSTDWVDIPIAPGFSSQGARQPQVSRDGHTVNSRWGWSNVGMAASTSYPEVGVIPAGFRPGGAIYFPAATHNATTSGLFVIQLDGRVELRTGVQLANYYLLPSVTWRAEN